MDQIVLPSGNVNVIFALAPIASPICSHSSTENFPVFRRLLRSCGDQSRRLANSEIVALFDKMTTQHTYYPECIKNIHYFDGWKTNKAHKINGKVILPVHGMMADPYWSRNTINVREAEATIGDIEKVFDYLDGNIAAEVDLHGVLERANEEKQTKNIPCKYFDVTLYKKGTMHIKFRNQSLVDRFNIYCSQKKGWLPPSYGRTTYSDMSKEEKAVVDGFHGDGAEGSGEKAYREVLSNRAYYLAEPTRQMPMLTAGN